VISQGGQEIGGGEEEEGDVVGEGEETIVGVDL